MKYNVRLRSSLTAPALPAALLMALPVLALAAPLDQLRADLDVDDSCRAGGAMRFQIWSAARLLYDSGMVTAPAVVKPEIDVRGLRQMSLRTLGQTGSRACGNWGNAALIGTEGATFELR